MTGKEDWEKKYREEIEEVNLRADMLCAWNDELKNKLSKYKRAFDILKDKLKIGVCFQDDYPDGYTLYGGGTKIISQEEYELLEELMSDA